MKRKYLFNNQPLAGRGWGSVFPIIMYLLIPITGFVVQPLCSQTNPDNNHWMSYLEELAGNEELEESYIENLYEELSYLSENPFNIHTVGKQDLERLPFLNAIQVENLLYYIYKYSPVVSLYELKNVESLDQQTIGYLLPFLYVGETEDKPQEKQILKWGKHEALLGTNFTVQRKAGYQKVSGEERDMHPNLYYRGSPYALSFRYTFNYRDKIQFGLTGEKDAGEVFWGSQQKGFDFYAANLLLKDFGVFKTLTFGDYRLAYGEGLVLNNHFSMGKTSDVININQKNTDIKRDVSTNENQFFRGVAGTLKFKQWESSFFFSSRRLDASVDSATISAFKTDGFHRTAGDREKEKTAETTLYGSHIQWKNDYLTAGMTAVYYAFGEKELYPDVKPYNLYYLRGKNHYNASINYSYRRKKWVFQGETAVDKSGKMAAIHNLLLYPASLVEWVCSYRYFDRGYNALYAKSFSESSAVRNESGFYTGVKFHLFRLWELAAYWDCFTFPWMKYGVDAPSSGNDVLFLLSYHPKVNMQMNVRYKWKEKEKNYIPENDPETLVIPYSQHQVRYQFNYQPHPALGLKTQADYHRYTSAGNTPAGWSIAQNASFAPENDRFQVDAGLAYFHTPDWNTRMNIYEKNVLYASASSLYYGEGLRYYALMKWKISDCFTFYLKGASTHYYDKQTISSGTEEISGKEKSDIYLLIRYKF
ncbi:MAG: helix-hairpin-helix domain-containing protein [Dysgonamonadaceae bacterium]|jgi:hypothetical protein|nr:helix-hairpin-helix domain-containing protein [Dysgonamonadaceae bacterium]